VLPSSAYELFRCPSGEIVHDFNGMVLRGRTLTTGGAAGVGKRCDYPRVISHFAAS
jgi:hypothetical protein